MKDKQIKAIWKMLGNERPITNVELEFADAILDAVAAAPAAQEPIQTPEQIAHMVPIEPTEKMIDAGIAAGYEKDEITVTNVYKAMVAAAPVNR